MESEQMKVWKEKSFNFNRYTNEQLVIGTKKPIDTSQKFILPRIRNISYVRFKKSCNTRQSEEQRVSGGKQ